MTLGTRHSVIDFWLDHDGISGRTVTPAYLS